MAGLESVTIRYLPGAERFLVGRGEGLEVDIRPEGIFYLGVDISAPPEVPDDNVAFRQREGRPHAWQAQLNRTRRAFLICLVCVLLTIAALMSARLRDVEPPVSYQDAGPGRPADILNSTTIFPLSTDVSNLLEDTIQLASYVTFLGISPHQVHRLLPGRAADGVEAGSGQARSERLWYGSLFNSATVPAVDSLCHLVANYDPVDRDWRRGSYPPESLARDEMLQLCQLTHASLQEADQAWYEARAAVGDLTLKATSRCKSLAVAFSDAELHHMANGAGWPTGTPGHPDYSDYSDPVWQRWVINTTQKKLFPLSSPLPLAGRVNVTVSALRYASAAALSNLTAIENAASTWLLGVSGHEASRCNKIRFHLTFLQRLCSCVGGEPEDIKTARELIRLTRRMRGYVLLASERAGVAARLASQTVSGWEELRSALQAVKVKDGNLHSPNAGVAAPADGTNISASPECPQRDGWACTTTTTKWAFESLDLLGEKLYAAAVSSQLRRQSVFAYEQVLWNEDEGGGV